jgi:hypothetical protein
MNEETKRRVKEYIERLKDDNDLPRYPPGEIGVFKVISARDSVSIDSESSNIIEGRFIDAIAYAVNCREYYANWISPGSVNNCNNGHVVKVNVIRLREAEGLDEVLADEKGVLLRQS